jgi:hypothetical protein
MHSAFMLCAGYLEILEKMAVVRGPSKDRPAVITALDDMLRLAGKAISG